MLESLSDHDISFLIKCIYIGSYPTICLSLSLFDYLNLKKVRHKDNAVQIGVISGAIPAAICFLSGATYLLLLNTFYKTLILKDTLYNYLQDLTRYQQNEIEDKWMLTKGSRYISTMHDEDFIAFKKSVVKNYQWNNYFKFYNSSVESKNLIGLLTSTLYSSETLRKKIIEYLSKNSGKKLYRIILLELIHYDAELFTILSEHGYSFYISNLILSY